MQNYATWKYFLLASQNGNQSKHNSSEVIFHRFGQICNLLSAFNCILCFQDIEKILGDICSISVELTRNQISFNFHAVSAYI